MRHNIGTNCRLERVKYKYNVQSVHIYSKSHLLPKVPVQTCFRRMRTTHTARRAVKMHFVLIFLALVRFTPRTIYTRIYIVSLSHIPILRSLSLFYIPRSYSNTNNHKSK